ncbi:MAG TPA: alpha/beta fold hydrolase [Myxococcales bacterium]
MSAVVRVGTAQAPDGALLAFRVEGEGGRALAACNGIGISSFWRALAAHFARRGDTFLTWDYRGQGASPPAAHPESTTVASCARDLWSVLDAVPVGRAVLLAHSLGAHVIVEAWRQKPERVLALVPMAGPVRFPAALRPLLRVLVEVGAANAEAAARALRALLALPGATEALAALGALPAQENGDRESSLRRLAALDLRGWFSLARDLLSRDTTRLFSEVRAPVLQLDAPLAGQPELIALKLEKFLETVESP